MSRLADRITKLERSRGNGYVASRFLPGGPETTVADYERLREKTLDEMVAAGEINGASARPSLFRQVARGR